MIGRQVGSYRIDIRLGEDGLGNLYAAQHVAAGFPATLRHFAAEFAEVAPVARYLELGRTVSQAGHPHIFNVRESVWSGRNAFIAGEPLPPHGNNLLDAIQGDGKILPELTVKLGLQIASALAAAHALNVFHSGLRAESIWVFADPQALGSFTTKIMDFGVHAFMRPGEPDWRTQRMEAIGLPYYMAPEQCRAGLVDFRSDVYSFGCILYHMIAGHPPFVHTRAEELAAAHKNVFVRGPAAFEPTLPPEVDTLVQRMMAKDANARPTMPQVAFELDRVWRHYWPMGSAPVHVPTVQVQVETRVGAPPPASVEPAEEEEEEEEARRWPIVAAVIGLALALAGLALAVTQPWKQKTVEAAPNEAKPAAVEVDAGLAAQPPPPPPQQHEAPPPRPSARDQHLADARKALVEERWADAAAEAKKAEELGAEDKTVAILVKQAQAEPANKKAYDDFMKSIDAKDVRKAAPKLKKIPSDSLYAGRARKAWDELIAAQVGDVKTLADAGNCAKAKALAMQLFDLAPDSAADLAKASAACR